MFDLTGKLIRIGDRLRVGGAWAAGTVVCSIDTAEYTAAYPEEAWGYLGRGILVDTDKAGLIHYAENNDEIEVIASAASRTTDPQPLP